MILLPSGHGGEFKNYFERKRRRRIYHFFTDKLIIEMESNKEKLLKKTYDDYIKLMLDDFPVDNMDSIVAKDVTGYGTTLDEKVEDINDAK
ncbi:MAG: hypothetical protein R2759_15565 [Bacteroidales bacterium]